jgi:hypothetical protein
MIGGINWIGDWTESKSGYGEEKKNLLSYPGIEHLFL